MCEILILCTKLAKIPPLFCTDFLTEFCFNFFSQNCKTIKMICIFILGNVYARTVFSSFEVVSFQVFIPETSRSLTRNDNIQARSELNTSHSVTSHEVDLSCVIIKVVR